MAMIDIGNKGVTRREAVAEGVVFLKPSVVRLIRNKKIPKGDVLETAKIAGILAAKNTPQIIPLCHPIPIEFVDIKFSFKKNQVKIIATARAEARTGVEMEALCAASAAALTIYDMCKPVDKDIVISDIKLIKKTGGKSGIYVRKN